MTSLDNSVSAQGLPAPVPHRGRMPLFEFFRTLRDNMVATYGEEAYERDIIERKMFGRRRFLVRLRTVRSRMRSARSGMRFFHFRQSRAKQLAIHDNDSFNYKILPPR